MSYFTAVSPSKLQIRNRNLCYIVDSDTCTAIDRYTASDMLESRCGPIPFRIAIPIRRA